MQKGFDKLFIKDSKATESPESHQKDFTLSDAAKDYTPVSDNPKDGADYAGRWLMAVCPLIIAIVPLFLLVLSLVLGWTIMFWISTAILSVLLVSAISLRFNYDKTSPRLQEAERAKRFLGFDFGENFTLKTMPHDILLFEFDKTSFVPLMEFCKSQEDSHERVDKSTDIIVTDILHMKEHRWFVKTESHYSPSLSTTDNLWIEFEHSCVVDYKNKTLKMRTVSW